MNDVSIGNDRSMYFLEGNIGAGKTSLGKILQDSNKYDFLEEPVDRWREGFANNLFEMFYEDMPRWSFTFQIMAFITRAKTWTEILDQIQGDHVVLERSIFTDRHVFAKNLYSVGAMNESEWQFYSRLVFSKLSPREKSQNFRNSFFKLETVYYPLRIRITKDFLFLRR